MKGIDIIPSGEDIAEIRIWITLVIINNALSKIKIIGGGVETKSLSVEEINNLASLPSLDEVRSKLIGLLMAGPTKLVRTIKEPSSRLARILATKK